MAVDATDLKRLSALLDTALELAPGAQEAWLASLPATDQPLLPALRRMLASHAKRETADFMQRSPMLALAPADDAPASPFAAGDTVGPYRLLRELGAGGMGEVWLAERADGGLKRQVALKLPTLGVRRAVLVQRFERERDILAGLEHPAIARLYDAGFADDGQPYLALEFVEGQPIDTWCRERALPVRERVKLLAQVGEAVAFAHSRLVLHRDLKPSNILVNADGHVRLLDFGIAKLMEGERTSETELTQQAGRALTLDYASPEQIRGEPIGTSSDVYSLGVVAYELLAGSRPYRLKRGGAAELEGAIAAIDAPLASATAADLAARQALKGDLDAILNKALKKHPGERYATVDAMVGDLERYLRGDRVVARPDTIGYRASRFVRRHRVPIGAVAVVAAAFALAIGIGATAVVILALLVGLGAAVWQGRAAARSRDRAYAMADRAEAVSEFLNLLLTQAARGGMALTPRQLLERSEQLVLREMRNNPEHRAAVLAMIGTSLQTLGNATDAERLLARALDAARIAGDPSFVDTIAAQHALSVGFGGRIEAAKATLEAIADRASAGPDQRAEANHYLALLAVNGGEADAALRRATEALRWLRASRRASPRFEASMLASLAGACSLNGRMVEADRHFEAALSRLAAQGQEHSPSAIAWMNNWAVVSERAGDLRRALDLYDRALAQAAQDAPDLPKPSYLVLNRARTLEYMGRLDDALAGFEEGLRIAQGSSLAPATFNAQLGLASVLVEQGRLDAARAKLAEADAGLPAPLPPTHPNALLRTLIGARLALRAGDAAAATAMFSSVVAERRPLATTVVGWLGRAEAHRVAAATGAARADADDALALAQELQGGKPHSFRTGLAWLARARIAQDEGREDAAREDAAKALGHLEATVDAGHRALAAARALAARPEPARSSAD